MSILFASTLLLTLCSFGLGNRTDIVFVIMSQENSYHRSLAQASKADIIQQCKSFLGDDPTVYITQENMPHPGDWTIIPLLPKLAKLHGNASWFIFLQDYTQLLLKELAKMLEKYDQDEQVLIGHAMNDKEPVILHHFYNPEDLESFKYPNFASGFAMSISLLLVLTDKIKANQLPSRIDFNIDPSHELARFVYDVTSRTILHDPAFCILEQSGCATLPRLRDSCDNKYVPPTALYYAVKTCTKFHPTRVPVVQKTWAKYVEKLTFFSDSVDKSIPTIDIGVKNTPHGHCAKTVAILRRVAKEIQGDPNVRWIVLADDDTILSPSGLLNLLTCYQSKEMVALGERYGFKAHQHGYNYLTGGAGSVFSRPLLEKLVAGKQFRCGSPDDPDDMFLGTYLVSLDIPVIHSPAFHQARPVDYPVQYLQSANAVSYHKHFMIDPVNVYREWFETRDKNFFGNLTESKVHYEL